MRKSKPLNREGFWYSEHSPYLPKPVPREKAWKGKREFLTALAEKESSPDANSTQYRGWSTCRICGCNNGSSDYELDGWLWPVGYSHYVEEHNVRPSLAFQEFILDYQIS